MLKGMNKKKEENKIRRIKKKKKNVISFFSCYFSFCISKNRTS